MFNKLMKEGVTKKRKLMKRKLAKIKNWFKIKGHQFSKKVKETKVFKTSKQGVWPFILPYLIIMVLLIVLPLLMILLYSVIVPSKGSLVFEINLKNFINFFKERTFVVSLLLSLVYALGSSLIAIVISYPVAYAMAFCKSKFLSRNIWILVTLPIWINMLLKSIGLKTLFNLIAPSLLGTPISIIIGMVYMFIPFVILPIFNSLERIDKSLIEASMDLGASKWKTFWNITFHQSVPGIISGGVMMMVQAATTLVIVRFLGEGKINLIAQVVESYFFKDGNFGIGSAISVVLAIIIFLIILISRLIAKKFTFKKGGRRNEKVS